MQKNCRRRLCALSQVSWQQLPYMSIYHVILSLTTRTGQLKTSQNNERVTWSPIVTNCQSVSFSITFISSPYTTNTQQWHQKCSNVQYWSKKQCDIATSLIIRKFPTCYNSGDLRKFSELLKQVYTMGQLVSIYYTSPSRLCNIYIA